MPPINNIIVNRENMLAITEFSSLSLDKLNNDEFTSFIRSVLALCDSVTLDKVGVQQSDYSAMKQKLEVMTEATRQTRYSTETQEIVDLDKKRNEVISFLLGAFRFERKNLIKERKEAAEVLYKVTKNYAGMQNLPLRQKTQIIEGLLIDLKKESNAQHIITLGLTTSVTGLDSFNKEMLRLVEGRAESQLVNNTINAKKVRKEATGIYKQMLKYIFAMHILHPSTEIANFIARLNKLIDDTSTANKLRFASSSPKVIVKEENKV